MSERKPSAKWARETSTCQVLRLNKFELSAWTDGMFEVTCRCADDDDEQECVTLSGPERAPSFVAGKLAAEDALAAILRSALAELEEER